jgi:hypothetical protein
VVRPPNGIPGPPSLQSSNPLSSLAPIGLQREVDRLAWQFNLDSVNSGGKSTLSQVLAHWAEGESDQLPGISKRNSTGQVLLLKGRRKTVIAFGVNVCANEWPDSPSLQA